MVVYLNHKQLLPQNKDPIDRITRYGSSVKNQDVGKQITRKNTWENNLVFDRNEEQSKYPKSIFFFDFSNS